MPNGGACDWGLPNAKLCLDCKSYYDPRNAFTNNNDAKCVWVPSRGKCFAKKWVIDNLGLPYEEDCTGDMYIKYVIYVSYHKI